LLSQEQHPDDVVITLAVRTPLCKAKKGGFKDTLLDTMIFYTLREVLQRSRIDPDLIEDVCLGNVGLSREYHRLTSFDNRDRFPMPKQHTSAVLLLWPQAFQRPLVPRLSTASAALD